MGHHTLQVESFEAFVEEVAKEVGSGLDAIRTIERDIQLFKDGECESLIKFENLDLVQFTCGEYVLMRLEMVAHLDGIVRQLTVELADLRAKGSAKERLKALRKSRNKWTARAEDAEAKVSELEAMNSELEAQNQRLSTKVERNNIRFKIEKSAPINLIDLRADICALNGQVDSLKQLVRESEARAGKAMDLLQRYRSGNFPVTAKEIANGN